jgi:hypothetical protein
VLILKAVKAVCFHTFVSVDSKEVSAAGAEELKKRALCKVASALVGA